MRHDVSALRGGGREDWTLNVGGDGLSEHAEAGLIHAHEPAGSAAQGAVDTRGDWPMVVLLLVAILLSYVAYAVPIYLAVRALTS
jgi:hypothetical protein